MTFNKLPDDFYDTLADFDASPWDFQPEDFHHHWRTGEFIRDPAGMVRQYLDGVYNQLDDARNALDDEINALYDAGSEPTHEMETDSHEYFLAMQEVEQITDLTQWAWDNRDNLERLLELIPKFSC